MKFAVTRTSSEWEREGRPPCKDAVREAVLHRDCQHVAFPGKEANIPDAWWQGGERHEVVNDINGIYAIRYILKPAWTTTLKTMEDLMALVKREGAVIVFGGGVDGEELPGLEVYDDHRD